MSDTKQAAQSYFEQGKLLKQQGKLSKAADCFRAAVRLQPDFTPALNNLGTALQGIGQVDEAIICFQEALRLNPDLAVIHCNLGAVLQARSEIDAAIASYERALRLQPDLYPAYTNLRQLLVSLGRMDEADQLYRKAIAFKPDWAQAHFDAGNLYWQRDRLEEAIDCFRAAIRSKPDFAAAYNSLGVALQTRQQMNLARACFRRALQLQPNMPQALINLGGSLELEGKWEAALSCYERAIAIEPEITDVFYRQCLLRLKLCDWKNYDSTIRELCHRTEALLNSGKLAFLPAVTLSYLPIPEALHAAVATYCARFVSQSANADKLRFINLKNLNNLKSRRLGTPEKLRIGYVSPDFRNHAIGWLIQGIFQHHNREEFEIYAYSLLGKNDDVTDNIRAGCDVFADISLLPTEQAARRIHADGIDILVDLAGYSTHSRPEIFALQPAPVQCSYLGYPDTMGGDFIQYLLADEWLIPEECAGYYTEKIVCLPHNFVASPVEISEKEMTRAEFGLPAEGTVFCCFNRHEKIDPQVFDVWARILQQVPGSVLWLQDGTDSAKDNLRDRAIARGVAANRLIFARELPVSEYLARYRLADLFLDTFIYNAASTAIAALQARVPVLTCPGMTNASRMGASICAAALLPEMICSSQEEYERRAVYLGNHPDELAAIRRKLAENSSSAPLFNPQQFVRHLEDAFQQIWAQQNQL